MQGYQLLTILLIFSLPFFPKQLVDTRIPSLIAIFSICLLPIFFRVLRDDIKRKFIPTLCFLVFLITLTITTIFSIDKQQSVIQLFLFFSYFIIFTTIHVIFRSLRSKELFVNCYLLIVTLLSFISLYNTLIRHYVNRQNVSFLWVYYGHNHLSALLIFAIPLCMYVLAFHWKESPIRFALFAIFFVLLVGLLFTFSIGAMFAFALSLLVVWFIFNKTLPLKKSFLIVFSIIILFALSSLYAFSMHKGIKDLNLRKDPYRNVSVRLTYWQKAFDNFAQRPITGSGLDTFQIVNRKSKRFIRYTHNFFIQILTDAGIFGFVASIALIGTLLWQGYQNVKTVSAKREHFFYLSLFVAVLSSTLLATIDVDWHLPTVSIFFWIFASLLRKHVN